MFEWIVHVIDTGGYIGVFALMVLENLFPPIPSEVILPLAGYAAASDGMNLPLVILFASLGAMVGGLPWYFAARLLGVERLKKLSARYGRLMSLSPSDIEGAEIWFKKHGPLVVLFGRLIPAIRTFISVPAGLARMPIGSFLLYSFIGSLIWSTTLATLGYWLQSQHDRVAAYLDPVSTLVIATLLGIYLYRVVTFKKNGSDQ